VAVGSETRGDDGADFWDLSPVEREDHWLKSWAFATSKDGLGLTTEESWALTTREFQALADVHEAKLNRWAIQQSMFANANFRGEDDEAWEPAHFLGRKKRASDKPQDPRITKALLDEAMNVLPQWAIDRINKNRGVN